jgi:hypothetical protein
VQLHRARSEFDAADVPIVLIGQATLRQAAHFRRRMNVDLPVLADKDRAAGAKVATAGELLGPKTVGTGVVRTVRSAARSTREGSSATPHSWAARW